MARAAMSCSRVKTRATCATPRAASAATRSTSPASSFFCLANSQSRYIDSASTLRIHFALPKRSSSFACTAFCTALAGIRPPRHTVIGREDHQHVLHPHLRIQVTEELVEQLIGSDSRLVRLRRIGPESVAHVVVRRETDSQQIRV